MRFFLLFFLLYSPNIFSSSNSEFIDLISNCSNKIQKTYALDKSIPLELVLAQAIIESNWGKSRFAIEGNNFFGMRTWNSDEPQLKPLKNKNAKFGLKVYETPCASVQDYLINLNNSEKYQNLRNIRDLEIKLWGKIDPKVLAKGLVNYSEEKNKYIRKVIKKIEILESQIN